MLDKSLMGSNGFISFLIYEFIYYLYHSNRKKYSTEGKKIINRIVKICK